MKISLITVVYNGETYLRQCMESVFAQQGVDLEYIVIDGASTDTTLSIIKSFENKIDVLVSEPDKGLYDAINKGIALSSGEVIGLLNADDKFADSYVLQKVSKAFQLDKQLQALYGDLNYIHPVSEKIIRRWKSKQAGVSDFENGWMPAHPTLYLKQELFDRYGGYALNFGSAADYELILRFLFKQKITMSYLPVLMVNMRVGGVSNSSFKNLIRAIRYDFKAMKMNGLSYPLIALFKKKLSKLLQY